MEELAALTGTSLPSTNKLLISKPAVVVEEGRVVEANLSRLDLRHLPSSLAGLSNLRVLFLRSNKLRELPPFLKELRKLEVLYVDDNLLETLPSWLWSLERLRELRVGENRLACLPPLPPTKNRALIRLFANDNHISEFPDGLDRLEALRCLNLRNNDLTKVPADLGHLTALTYLDLSHNRIDAIPVHLTALVDLQNLFLEGNPLEVFPAELERWVVELEKRGCLVTLPAEWERKIRTEEPRAFVSESEILGRQPDSGRGERSVLDLRGVKCPLNFVKTKLRLEEMPDGAVLTVLLDGGEPVNNVPRSVKAEGHEVLAVEPRDGHFELVVKKKEGKE